MKPWFQSQQYAVPWLYHWLCLFITIKINRAEGVNSPKGGANDLHARHPSSIPSTARTTEHQMKQSLCTELGLIPEPLQVWPQVMPPITPKYTNNAVILKGQLHYFILACLIYRGYLCSWDYAMLRLNLRVSHAGHAPYQLELFPSFLNQQLSWIDSFIFSALGLY